MEQKTPTVGVVKESEPPVYQEQAPASTTALPPPKYVATPLPTYAQSERFEKEGVALQAGSDTDSSESSIPVRTRWSYTGSGTCTEFIIFFIVCTLFSAVGFIFSFCLATTTAAQSGAVAGLGTAFISKPLFYEFYYRGYEQEWSKAWCAQHAEIDKCVHWTTTTMRTIFFILGFIGLVLLYKGFASFFASRRPANN